MEKAVQDANYCFSNTHALFFEMSVIRKQAGEALKYSKIFPTSAYFVRNILQSVVRSLFLESNIFSYRVYLQENVSKS